MKLQIFVLLSTLILIGATSAGAQTTQSQLPALQQQQAPLDPIQQLNLTPEQRQRIREIREQTKDERAAINQRVRETNQALDAVLESDNPDDAQVEQRLRDAASAQAASMRMRILTELRIRRVLTLEQLATLRTMRQQVRENRRDRLQDERRMQRENNGNNSLFPRRALQQRRRP